MWAVLYKSEYRRNAEERKQPCNGRFLGNRRRESRRSVLPITLSHRPARSADSASGENLFASTSCVWLSRFEVMLIGIVGRWSPPQPLYSSDSALLCRILSVSRLYSRNQAKGMHGNGTTASCGYSTRVRFFHLTWHICFVCSLMLWASTRLH